MDFCLHRSMHLGLYCLLWWVCTRSPWGRRVVFPVCLPLCLVFTLPPSFGAGLFGVFPRAEQSRESMPSQKDKRIGHSEIPVFHEVRVLLRILLRN